MMQKSITGLVLALLCCSPNLSARQADSEQPLNVKAKHLGGSLNEGVTVLDKGVQITQGSLTAQADRGEIHRDAKGEISKVLLTGAPARLQQDLDDGQRMQASASTITYKLSERLVELSGGAQITRGADRLEGALIRYEVGTGRYSADGVGGQVQFSIQPKPKKPAAEAGKGKAE